MKNITSILRLHPLRAAGILVFIAIAVFAVVRIAGANDAQAGTVSNTASTTAVSTSSRTSGGSCCSGGSSATPTEGTALVSGGVQKVSVDLSSGSYNPSVLRLKAGIPTEITFGQSSGCTAYVQSQALGFQADLTGGPQTVTLPALQAGTYDFECGMSMVTGEIIVQ
jgi:plastocyanin